MGEQVFEKSQIGTESTEGTGVAASIIFPHDPGVEIDLDRATTSPEEDYGGISRHRPGRSSHGLRNATFQVPGVLTFERFMYLLEMHGAGGISPSGVGPYTWAYAFDETSDTLKSRTWERGDNVQAWRSLGTLCGELELGYDALAAPGEAPWKFSATMLGRDREANAFTGALAAPSVDESIEGHLTRLYEGAIGTAFASLTELSASLVQYRLRSSIGLTLRPYGSAGDKATGHGRQRREVTVEALVKSASGSKTNILDIWNVSGAVPTERRWRVQATGSGTKVFTVDHRLNFSAVQLGERDGEVIYAVNGYCVYDSTLASDVKITGVNSVAALT